MERKDFELLRVSQVFTAFPVGLQFDKYLCKLTEKSYVSSFVVILQNISIVHIGKTKPKRNKKKKTTFCYVMLIPKFMSCPAATLKCFDPRASCLTPMNCNIVSLVWPA